MSLGSGESDQPIPWLRSFCLLCMVGVATGPALSDYLRQYQLAVLSVRALGETNTLFESWGVVSVCLCKGKPALWGGGTTACLAPKPWSLPPPPPSHPNYLQLLWIFNRLPLSLGCFRKFLKLQRAPNTQSTERLNKVKTHKARESQRTDNRL